MTAPGERFVVVIPAAGVGQRMGSDRPKQYVDIAGRPMLEWSVRVFLQVAWVEQIAVVVAAADQTAKAWLERIDVLPAARQRVVLLELGGATRRDTVLNGVQWLQRERKLHERDWLLVHDAARPGLELESLERLRRALQEHPCGGLLALPVVDTVKRADDDGMVAATVARAGLWLAQTPQMFRLGPLRDALRAHADITDESSALEREGFRPLLVEGNSDNFKVTHASDLQRIRDLLGRRESTDGAA